MGMHALQSIEKLNKKKKVVKKAPVEVADHVEKEEPEEAQPKVVRVPRTTPAPIQKRVDKLIDGEAISDDGRLGKSIETQARRQEVTAWMLNGHSYDNQLCDMPTLAAKLGVPVSTVNNDVKAIKTRMAEFYTKDDDTRDIAALAHMLLEMKFRDRGQALNLYNMVLQDLHRMDQQAAQRKKENRFSKMDGFGELSGRDRAAMYSTMLAAIDLANRTTNGMESLLKLTGGAKKLQIIINAKNAQFNAKGGAMIDAPTVQGMIAEFMGGVLPSNRHLNPGLGLPPDLQLDEEDERIMSIAKEDKPKTKKVIDAQL